MAGYSQSVAIVRLVILRVGKVGGFLRVLGSSELMKQVYYRYLDCLNRKLRAVDLAGAPSLLYGLFIPLGFQALCGLDDILLQVVPSRGKKLLRTGKDSLALYRNCGHRKCL
jgi:hypothetical protein